VKEFPGGRQRKGRKIAPKINKEPVHKKKVKKFRLVLQNLRLQAEPKSLALAARMMSDKIKIII